MTRDLPDKNQSLVLSDSVLHWSSDTSCLNKSEYYFDVEQFIGKRWMRIDEIVGSGNMSYKPTLFYGKNKYRLRQYDFYGNQLYSNSVSVNIKDTTAKLQPVLKDVKGKSIDSLMGWWVSEKDSEIETADIDDTVTFYRMQYKDMYKDHRNILGMEFYITGQYRRNLVIDLPRNYENIFNTVSTEYRKKQEFGTWEIGDFEGEDYLKIIVGDKELYWIIVSISKDEIQLIKRE